MEKELRSSLQRFIEAQEGVYERALSEIKNGRKTSHWIWYIFPQIAGLGWSANSKYYAIANEAEALAYLGHPLLGNRLRSCAEALLTVEGKRIEEIVGEVDAQKICSSMTLFYAVGKDELFAHVLRKYYAGNMDEMTLGLLQSNIQSSNQK